jgi:hypothetical protein
MQPSNRELWISFIAMAFITVMYLVVVILFRQVPGASDFFGHSLGVLGFILMLATETLYSLRKRSRSARWGKMSAWLQFHIFTGLVGPYMVLLHSAWKFNGLAGMVMLLTVVIVFSGFVGRYIYTAVPRSLDGAELEASVLEQEIQHANGELTNWLAGRPESIRVLARRMSIAAKVGSIGMSALIGRSFVDLGTRLRWGWERMKMDAAGREQARHLERLLQRQVVLQRQLSSLAIARRLLGLWYTIHIPIGLSLFVAAFIHIVAAIYYATLLR